MAATLPLEQAERLPTSAMSEAALFRGYSGGPKTRREPLAGEPCACGGRIDPGELDLTVAVVAHNRSTAHQQWRLRRREEA